MKIIILGAGKVGVSLARNLVEEGNDIVLVDPSSAQLDEVKQRLDIQTVCGHVSHPEILINAGIEQADLVIAVTKSDEVNMVACYIAVHLYKTQRTIARIKAEDYYKHMELFKKNNFPIQTLIYPSKIIVEHIVRIIKYPGVSQILNFFNDTVCIIAIEILENHWMNGKTIAAVKQKIAKMNADIIALFQDKKSVELSGELILTPQNNLLCITPAKSISTLLNKLGLNPPPNQSIMICGGGIIGGMLAKKLEHHYQVKLIEKNPTIANELASQLEKAIVLEGDIADRDLLISENIQETDVFCALSDDDEANIMSSLQAKFLGAKYAMTLVTREAYVDLIEESLIDYALSPQVITIGNILSKLRRGNMIKVHRLQDKETEAIELIVEGTHKTSAVIGRPLCEIDLPPHCIIAGVIRGKKLLTHNPHLKLATNDHVILLLLKKKYIHQLEALFQVNLAFMS